MAVSEPHLEVGWAKGAPRLRFTRIELKVWSGAGLMELLMESVLNHVWVFFIFVHPFIGKFQRK